MSRTEGPIFQGRRFVERRFAKDAVFAFKRLPRNTCAMNKRGEVPLWDLNFLSPAERKANGTPFEIHLCEKAGSAKGRRLPMCSVPDGARLLGTYEKCVKTTGKRQACAKKLTVKKCKKG